MQVNARTQMPNYLSSSGTTTTACVPLLTTIHPRPRCVAHTGGRGEIHGPSLSLSLEADRSDRSRPDIRSLSVASCSGGPSRPSRARGGDRGRTGGRKRGRSPATPADDCCDNVDGDDDFDDASRRIRDEMSRLPGLEERLSDAARGAASGTIEGRGQDQVAADLAMFLLRSQAVFAELLAALRQNEQKQKAQRKAEGASTNSGHGNSSSPDESGSSVTSCSAFPLPYYSAIVDQVRSLHLIRRVKISSMDDGLSRLVLSHRDRAGRTHDLHVELSPSFPIGVPVFASDLPVDFEPRWTAASPSPSTPSVSLSRRMGRKADENGLAGVAIQFLSVVERYQPLWDELGEIDSDAWVLEPALPARKSSVARRLAVRSGGLSVALVLDPDHPRSPPTSLRFVGGSTSDADALRRSYHRYVAGTLLVKSSDVGEGGSGDEKGDGHHTVQWTEEKSVLENLKACLGGLPSPATTVRSDYMAECGICYSHRLPIDDDAGDEADGSGGLLPDAACGNASCGRSYHENCLFEWLHSLPTARVSFDRVFGTCPYCCEPISVRATTQTK